MRALPFSYQNNVRTASFVGIDRAPASACGGRRISLKKVLDIVVAAIAMALSAPLMLRAAQAIKLEWPGPIIFRRKRIGRNGSISAIWKFRSNCDERPGPDAARQTSKDNPRVIRRAVRRSRIDDLPRLKKSIQCRVPVAGPRARALDIRGEGRLLAELFDDYAARHRDKPGITGSAQINGLRGELASVEAAGRARHQVYRKISISKNGLFSST